MKNLFAFLFIGTLAITAVTSGELSFDPPLIDVVRDSTGFVQTLVKFRSVYGDTIRITSINGSCKCAMGTVQRPMAYDTLPGTIYLGINAKHFTDTLNYVDYTIAHTGSDKPSMYRVIVRLPH